jgi:hypothetical protein
MQFIKEYDRKPASSSKPDEEREIVAMVTFDNKFAPYLGSNKPHVLRLGLMPAHKPRYEDPGGTELFTPCTFTCYKWMHLFEIGGFAGVFTAGP